jgi:hypothetical protein
MTGICCSLGIRTFLSLREGAAIEIKPPISLSKAYARAAVQVETAKAIGLID